MFHEVAEVEREEGHEEDDGEEDEDGDGHGGIEGCGCLRRVVVVVEERWWR